MSSKSSKSPKKVNLPPPPPRAMPEIQAENEKLCSDAGKLQYHIKVYENQLASINNRLYEINNEASQRNAIDAAQAKASEVPSEQS
jgi:hypothetical protein